MTAAGRGGEVKPSARRSSGSGTPLAVDPARLAGQADLLGASAAELSQLAGLGRVRWLRPGETLYEAGSSPDRVYWVVDGFLNGSAGSVVGRPATVPFGGAGQGCWGSRDLLLDRPRLHRVWSTGHTEVVEVGGPDFLRLLLASPQMLEAQIRYYVDQIRANSDVAGWQVDLDLPQRLGRVLLERFTRGGFVDLPMRRDDLARILGVTRPEVSTALGRLVRRGLLAGAGGGAFSVVDRAGLEAYVRLVPDDRPRPSLRPGAPPAPAEIASSPLLTVAATAGLTRHELPPGTLLARRDDPVDTIFVVLGGIVSLRAPTRSGGFRLADARAGDGVLGAGPVVAGRPWPVDLVTVDRTTVVGVPAESARSLLPTAVGLEPVLLRLAAHLAQVAVLRAQGPGVPPRVRLARLIADRAGQDAIVAMSNGGADIASELGTSRQSVSTSLADLRRAGIVTGSTRGGLRVTDAHGLARWAGGLSPTRQRGVPRPPRG